METTKSVKGSCLCGAVALKAGQMSLSLGACHCAMCRKWSAGPFLTVECGIEVTIEGKEHLGIYSSSDWAERGFCKQCGSSLFYRLKASQQYFVNAEIFNQTDLVFDHQVFIDEKPAYYEFANQTQNMTGQQLFEAFANQQ